MKTNKLSKLLMLFIAMALIPTMASATATSGGNAAFGTFAAEITSWLTGNLGYVIAIFSFFGSLLIYAFTHKGGVIIIGVIIAILVGGGTGITKLFFQQGKSVFSDTGTFT